MGVNHESLSLTVEEGFEVLLIAIGSKSVDDTKWRDESLVVSSPWHQHQAGKGQTGKRRETQKLKGIQLTAEQLNSCSHY